jgi:CheY-like chemotaxis protein
VSRAPWDIIVGSNVGTLQTDYTKPVVLSVEDDKDTTSAVIAELRSLSVAVVEVTDILEAERACRDHQFALILIDLRINRGDVFLEDGGVQFVRQLKAGVFGEHNVLTPFAMLTAFPLNVPRNELARLPGFVSVFSKTAPVIADLAASARRMLPWFPTAALGRMHSHVVDDLLIIDGVRNSRGHYRAKVGAWHGGSLFLEPQQLPPEVEQELAYGVFPVYAWAKLNIDAATEAEVLPHDFRLVIPDQGAKVRFDWDPEGRSTGGLPA